MQRRCCFSRSRPVCGVRWFRWCHRTRQRHLFRGYRRGGDGRGLRCFGHARRRPGPVRPIQDSCCTNEGGKGRHCGGEFAHVICVNLTGNNTLPHCLPSYNTFCAQSEGEQLPDRRDSEVTKNARRPSFRGARLHRSSHPPAAPRGGGFPTCVSSSRAAPVLSVRIR